MDDGQTIPPPYKICCKIRFWQRMFSYYKMVMKPQPTLTLWSQLCSRRTRVESIWGSFESAWGNWQSLDDTFASCEHPWVSLILWARPMWEKMKKPCCSSRDAYHTTHQNSKLSHQMLTASCIIRVCVSSGVGGASPPWWTSSNAPGTGCYDLASPHLCWFFGYNFW